MRASPSAVPACDDGGDGRCAEHCQGAPRLLRRVVSSPSPPPAVKETCVVKEWEWLDIYVKAKCMPNSRTRPSRRKSEKTTLTHTHVRISYFPCKCLMLLNISLDFYFPIVQYNTYHHL